MILLWGVATEGPLAAVRAELDCLGAPNQVIDQRDVLDTEIDLDIAETASGELRIRDRHLDLAAVTACYVRPYDIHDLPAVADAGPDSAAWRHADAVEETLSCWSAITSALVVNPLQAMASNNSKPYQLDLIRHFGFAIPPTLVTTCRDEALAFWHVHGDVIYKSVSGVRSRVARLRPEHLDRLSDVAACPTQFQQYIAGTDHRVHVVANEVFACEVRAEGDDYRYPQGSVEIRATQLPPCVEAQCMRLSRALGLSVTGIDLRRTPDDAWYCFEVNPSPAFSYYQDETGQPIDRAIARLLAEGSPTDSRRKGRCAP
jgi:RimK-like ATP-grasp domain